MVLLLIAVLTLFQTRRLYAEVLARGLARLGFWLYGIRIVEHHEQPLPQTQVVFIANHWSLLDPFVVIALGLPNLPWVESKKMDHPWPRCGVCSARNPMSAF